MGFTWSISIGGETRLEQVLELTEIEAVSSGLGSRPEAKEGFDLLFGGDTDEMPVGSTCAAVARAAQGISGVLPDITVKIYQIECSPCPGVARVAGKGVGVMNAGEHWIFSAGVNTCTLTRRRKLSNGEWEAIEVADIRDRKSFVTDSIGEVRIKHRRKATRLPALLRSIGECAKEFPGDEPAEIWIG